MQKIIFIVCKHIPLLFAIFTSIFCVAEVVYNLSPVFSVSSYSFISVV